MNPSLRHMRALVALAKTGSFTLAAEHLHLTQSALSGQRKTAGLGQRHQGAHVAQTWIHQKT